MGSNQRPLAPEASAQMVPRMVFCSARTKKPTIHRVWFSASVVKVAMFDGHGKCRIYRCTSITGFDLVCYASKKTYVLRYLSPTPRKQLDLKIRSVSDLTFSQAEKAARKA